MTQPKTPTKPTKPAKPIRAYGRLMANGPHGEQSLREFLKENGGQIVGMSIGKEYFPVLKK